MNADLENKYRLSKMLAAAFVASLGIYGAVLVILLKTRTASMPEQSQALLTQTAGVLAAVALLGVVSAGSVRKMIRKQSTSAPPASRFFVGDLVAYALCEIPSLIGFAAAIFCREFNLYWITAIFSLAGYLVYWPRPHQWETGS